MEIGGLLQSGGIVTDIWKKAASKISNSLISNILIFGLGCGTAAQVMAKRFPQAKITGVEIDPVVVSLGKKYFALGNIPNLKLVVKDALDYKTSNKFDVILVDMYQGEKIPEKTESIEFLKKVKSFMSQGGILIINRIFWDEHKAEAQAFVQKCQKVFGKVELARTVANLLVICS